MNSPAPTTSRRMRTSPAFLFLLPLLFLINPSLWAYPVPDTGQTESYTDTFGEDSDYLINPPSYTKLDAAGNDLPDSAAAWVMVRDNVTGLIWEVKTDDGSVHDKDNQYTWYDSDPATNGGNAGTSGDGKDTEDFIYALNAESFGDFTDWRLPTIKELDSIVNLGTTIPTIDTAYFPNTVSSGYWSSSTDAYSTGYALRIYFGYGNDSTHLKSDAYYVRAVRGGQAGSLGHLVINGDGTVIDTSSGLMWQQAGVETEMIWKAALSYCEGLSLAGYSDWRLPNQKELRSIVDYNVYNPAIDTTYFPNAESSNYWSSSPTTYYTGGAWGIDFYYGRHINLFRPDAYYVRAVRGGQARLLGHLVISTPSQGSMWKDGDIMPIRWNTSGISGNVKISISSQGGKDGTFQTIIGSTPNNGSYDWTVNTAASVNCVLKVEPVSDTAKGTTQGLFSIEASEAPFEAPSKPELMLTISGLQLSLSWYNVANADGYIFSYAPAPYTGPDTIRTIDMAAQTSFSIELWDGAAFFVAVQAYNDVGVSEYSNIEYFEIDYLPPINVTPSTLSLSPGETKTCEISGGTRPYNAASSDPRIATVSVSANLLYVTGISTGSTTLILHDDGGDFVVYVTVGKNSAPTPVGEITATAYMNLVVFAWVPSSDSDIAYYQYMLDIHEMGQGSKWSGSWVITQGTTVSRELTEEEKTTYAGKTVEICIKVLAVNDFGSESSAEFKCANPDELWVEPHNILHPNK